MNLLGKTHIMPTKITYVGHATVHVKQEKRSFLTDPNFSGRVWTIKRQTPLPEVALFNSPDVIFVSHAHYDHLNIHSYKYFSSKIPIVMPKGLGKLITRACKNPIIEMYPGETVKLMDDLQVTSFPVNHRGFRLSGFRYTGCNGYLIESEGVKTFFPGDTGYRSDFADFQNVDIALLPLGPCNPEKMMRPRHMNHEDVLKVTSEMKPKITIPIHWGTFRLGLDSLMKPMNEFKKLLKDHPEANRIKILNPGEAMDVSFRI